MPVKQTDIDAMRNLGGSLADKGFFEVDLISGQMAWMNECALMKMGYTVDQIQNMSIFDIVPSEFQEAITNIVSDTISDKNHKYGVWPFKSADGGVVWWYTVREKDASPLYWYKGEYLNKTDRSGPDYASMCLTMSTVNNYNDLHVKFQEHVSWTRQEIKDLKDNDEKTWVAIEDVKRIGRGAHAAAEKAANYALANEKSIRDLNDKIDEGFSKQTTEIFRLISTDAAHDARIEAYEKAVESATTKAAEKAVNMITAQAEKAGKTITVKAQEAGKGLSKKVSVPVGIIATVIGIIQLILNHWLK